MPNEIRSHSSGYPSHSRDSATPGKRLRPSTACRSSQVVHVDMRVDRASLLDIAIHLYLTSRRAEHIGSRWLGEH